MTAHHHPSVALTNDEIQDPQALVGMHVVLIVENEAVPFDRRMWNMSKALRDFGAEVSVICPKFGVDSLDDEVLEGIRIHRYTNTFSDGTVQGYLREYANAFVKTALLVARLLWRGERPDVVHVANPPDIFWPLALCLRMLGVAFIFDEHDLSPQAYQSRFGKDEASAGLLFKAQVWCQRLSYRFADGIISTNESYRASALNADRTYAAKIFVVRNGPDTRSFRTCLPNPALKNGHKYLAAYIGVMAVQDGVEYVIRALDELVNKRGYQDLIVYLIGKGDDWQRLKDLTDELGLGSHCVFTGRIPDEPALEILSTADVALSPDPKSPLNDVSTMTKIMEYMALGKPIVSFDLKETRFSAGESALYVENNDATAFADGILRILEDADLSERMAGLGVERVATTLSWQKQSVNLLRAYRFVLSESR